MRAPSRPVRHALTAGAGVLGLATGFPTAGCRATSPSATPTSAPPTAAAEPPVVRLERGGCYGGCAPRRVELWSNGRVTHTTLAAGPIPGAATTGRVAPADVGRLLARFAAAGFADLDTAYVVGAPGCGAYAADAPVVVLSVGAGAAARTVRHDHGCADAPRVLVTLEAAVDSAAARHRWLRSPTAGGR